MSYALLKMNKRGSYQLNEELVGLTIFRILLVMIIVIFVVLIVNRYVSREVKVGDFNAYLIESNLLSENCLGYNDGFRFILGTVDNMKLNQENLDHCMSYNKNYGIKVKMFDKEFFYNKEVYENNFSFCEQYELKCSQSNIYVLDQNKNPSVLKVEVVNIE